jgi:hypothetical protein
MFNPASMAASAMGSEHQQQIVLKIFYAGSVLPYDAVDCG